MNHDQKPGMRCVSRRFQTLAMLFVLASGSLPVAAQNFYLTGVTMGAPVEVTLNGSGTNCDDTWEEQETGEPYIDGGCENGTYTSISLTFSNSNYILPDGKTAGTISNRARIGGTRIGTASDPTLSGSYSTSALTISWDSGRGCATSGLDGHMGTSRTRPLGFHIGTNNEDVRGGWEVARYATGEPDEFVGWDINVVLFCTAP